MTITEKKLELINKLSQLKNETVLSEIEKILTSEELNKRAKESETNIFNGDVISLNEFQKRNKSWIKRRTMK